MATLVTNYLTNSVTNSCLVDLIYVTLLCEDANSNLADAVTVVDIDDEDHVSNSLLQIFILKFHQLISCLMLIVLRREGLHHCHLESRQIEDFILYHVKQDFCKLLQK